MTDSFTPEQQREVTEFVAAMKRFLQNFGPATKLVIMALLASGILNLSPADVKSQMEYITNSWKFKGAEFPSVLQEKLKLHLGTTAASSEGSAGNDKGRTSAASSGAGAPIEKGAKRPDTDTPDDAAGDGKRKLRRRGQAA